MTDAQLFACIEQELFVDEGVADAAFRSNKRAEYLERAVYVCPFCGLSRFESHGNEVECLTCHRKVTYGEDKRLIGVGYDFPFAFTTEWYDYQKDFINRFDVTLHTDKPLYEDTATLSEVILNQRKERMREDAKLSLYGDRVVIDEGAPSEITFLFSDATAVTVLGRNKLNIYYDGHVYQLKGDKRFNALKYVNMFYHYKNVSKGDTCGQFLGL